jgi:hypothetical protein
MFTSRTKKIVREQLLSAKPTSVVHEQHGPVRCPQKLQDPFFVHTYTILLQLKDFFETSFSKQFAYFKFLTEKTIFLLLFCKKLFEFALYL